MSDSKMIPVRFTKNPFPSNQSPDSPKQRDGHEAGKRNIDCIRTRLFALMTYATHEQIMYCLSLHGEQIRYSTFILHDKDVNNDGELKIAHSHVVIETYNAYRVGSVRGWFKSCVDDDGKPINTLGQPVVDRKAVIDYLTHEHHKHKAQYSRDCIVNYSEALLIAQEKPRIDDDRALLIIDDIMAGVPEYVLCRRYGREYIINAHRYRDMIFHILGDHSLPEMTDDLKIQLYRKFYYCKG